MPTVLTRRCLFCGKEGEVELTNAQYRRYNQSRHPSGAHIQDALWDVDPGEREQLLTGIHNQCWEKAFAE